MAIANKDLFLTELSRKIDPNIDILCISPILWSLRNMYLDWGLIAQHTGYLWYMFNPNPNTKQGVHF